MMFTTLPAMANFIRNTHYQFGAGCFIGDALTILARAKAVIDDPDNAVTGITFDAWQDVPDYGSLHTYITVSRADNGAWLLTESTLEPA